VTVEFQKEGGVAYLPGLAKPVVFDTASLPADQSAALEALVRDVAFFDLPAALGQPKRGSADYRTYTVTVSDGKRKHTVRVTDLAADPKLAELVRWLDTRANEQRRKAAKQ
jgi:hypothetical protein